MSPCLHQFCLGCAQRWVRHKANCPLCRTATMKILFSVVSNDDYLTFDVPEPAEPSAEDSEDEATLLSLTPDDDPLVADQLGPTEPWSDNSEEEREAEEEPGGFSPQVWADFFNSHRDNMQPLLPWLRWELGRMYGREWWEAAVVETTVMGFLCVWGLDELVLGHHLFIVLEGEARSFVRRLVATAVELCSGELLRHLGWRDTRAAMGEDDSPAASPSPTACTRASHSSPTGSHVEEKEDKEEQDEEEEEQDEEEEQQDEEEE